jgi:hypothetical protein
MGKAVFRAVCVARVGVTSRRCPARFAVRTRNAADAALAAARGGWKIGPLKAGAYWSRCPGHAR